MNTQLNGVVESFFSNLTPTERDLFVATNTVEAFLNDILSVERTYNAKSTSRKVSAALKPFVAGIEQYAKAFDVIANASSMILSPLWGSFRIVLKVITRSLVAI